MSRYIHMVSKQMLHCKVPIRSQAQANSAEPLLKWWVLVDQLMCHVDVDSATDSHVDYEPEFSCESVAFGPSIPTCPENSRTVVRTPSQDDVLVDLSLLEDLADSLVRVVVVSATDVVEKWNQHIQEELCEERTQRQLHVVVQEYHRRHQVY